jgi:hypothetical protein
LTSGEKWTILTPRTRGAAYGRCEASDVPRNGFAKNPRRPKREGAARQSIAPRDEQALARAAERAMLRGQGGNTKHLSCQEHALMTKT